MPVNKGVADKNKAYYKWGMHGTKYYFNPNNAKSEQEAREKAAKQGRAIERSIALRKTKNHLRPTIGGISTKYLFEN